MKVGDKVILRNVFSENSLEGIVTKVEPDMFDVKTNSKNIMLKTMYFSTNMQGLGRFSRWTVEGVIKS